MGNLFGALGISASGMTAERLRMDVTSDNLANADSTRGPDGQPYRRQEVVLQTGGQSFSDALGNAQAGVQVAGIVDDPTPGQQVYDPGNPDANAQGYVTMPNVNTVTEMTDLITESRSYEANTQAMTTAKELYLKTIDLLR
ncbi:MAG TPA: flagellar basal body rod protein FlgC [Gaiellaceae bacterium]|jgi:flagellar basal-body rod protein FlgC|nr:flagellar basal body rod protein FlgC [Gaiellaceae bacterium]